MDIQKVIPDPRLLHSTGAVGVANGLIGGANGFAGDTRLYSVMILKNAGPSTLTITGFRGEDNTARAIVLTGSATVDTWYSFPGLKNSGAAMTLTASVADTVLVGLTGA